MNEKKNRYLVSPSHEFHILIFAIHKAKQTNGLKIAKIVEYRAVKILLISWLNLLMSQKCDS